MKKLLKYVTQTPFMKHLKTMIQANDKIELTDTNDALNLLIIAYIKEHFNKNILIVHHNLYHAQKLYDHCAEMDNDTLFFPQDEFITTDMLAMSESLKLERLDTIQALKNDKNHLVITHPTGFIKTMLPKHYHQDIETTYHLEQTVDIEAFILKLVHLGYKRTSGVEKPGDFTVRGSLIDIYQPQYEHPIRVDFFDNEIDSIRVFNVQTQRSIKKINTFTILPRVEFFYSDEQFKHIERRVLNKLKTLDMSQEVLTRITNELEQLRHHENQDQLARYMSFLGEKLETISDYLDHPIVIYINKDYVKKSYHQIRDDLAQWTVDTQDYPKLGFDFIRDLDTIYHEKSLYLNPFSVNEKNLKSLALRAKEANPYEDNLHMLIKDLVKYENYVTVLITINDDTRLKKMIAELEDHVDIKVLGPNDAPFSKKINITKSDNPLSFEWMDINFILLTEKQLFHDSKKVKKKHKAVFKDTKKIGHVKELEKGDYLVHYDHGIGRFLGVETITLQEYVNDYIVIAYRGDDTLYIPVENVHLIQKFVAHEGIIPKLNKLGSADWAKTKQRVRKKAKDIAKKLLKIYAEREQAKGFAFSKDSDLMHLFEADFMFEETEDQIKAIEDVKHDMEQTKPMDRLLCGDVGYGKTEVALRAAFKATLDNKQVAYLAPTTVLSRQHYYTFKDRMEKHGIKVALLNRFVTRAQQKHYLEGIKSGKYDVIIGTHRLLSKDLIFKDLGLLIVDEEQRFGVEHKERIKAMKAQVDVLSLSATPIPRTLQMAMTGIKQMSLLETPPKNRLPIQTYVLKRNDHVIKDAIERELSRNGQIFYLYNRVEKIEVIQDHLQKLVPDARIAYAHGQMSRLELERVMNEFLDHNYDVLVSTTIIETGIDIPNANTLIIHEADRLGLSQLYQIRGRVGRSDRIAYSYLMYDKTKVLNEEASKRLQVIKEFTELGSGFKIASRDLAIRGAGDILGTEQSGFIDSVGIDLFLEMLKEEIVNEQNGEQPETLKDDKQVQAIKLKVSKTIPNDYIQDDDLKIDMHRRISDLHSTNEFLLLKDEFTDRFGEVPKTLELYMLEKLYENLAVEHAVERVKESQREIRFVLTEEKTKTVHGDLLFAKANELSPHINLDYKQNKIHLVMLKNKLEKSVLHYIIPLLESL